MKIAICFSGMIRTGVEATPAIKHFIGDLWNHCDFFLHTWNLDYHNVLTGETPEHFGQANPNLNLDLNKVEKLKEFYKFKLAEVDDYWAAMNSSSDMFSNYVISDQWIIPWFYSWHKSVLLKKKWENINGFKYDVVVKLRPDVIFNKELTLKDYIDRIADNDFGINLIYNDSGIMVPDDIVFVSKGNTCDLVADWWIDRLVTKSYLKTDKNTFSYFYDFIKSRGVNPVDLDLPYVGENYKIGLLRQECTIFDSVSEFDKCVECDRLHYHVLEQKSVKHISEQELAVLKEHTLAMRKTLPNGLK